VGDYDDEHPLDRLERLTVDLSRQAQWDSANRLGLLRVHAAVGVLVGALMACNGTSTNFEQYLGGWMRLATGVPAFVGGALLAWGVSRKPRSIPLEAAGLTILVTWDIAMVVGFIAALVAAPDLILWFWPWQVNANAGAGGRLYPVVVYAGYAFLILEHLRTLWHIAPVGHYVKGQL